MMQVIENQKFDQERALYGSQDLMVKDSAPSAAVR